MSKYQYDDNGDCVTLLSPTGMTAVFWSRQRDEFLQVIRERTDEYFDRDSPWDFTSLDDGLDHCIALYLDEACTYCEKICGSSVCDACQLIHGGDA
jgi:hypothetical protein